MPQKRVPPPRKDPSPPPSSSYTSSEEEEEEEGNHNIDPTSSQPPAKKPTSDLNQTPNSDSSTEEEDDEDSEDEKDVRSQSKPAQEKEDDEEEDSDESDSDSDSPPPNVKSARPSPRGADLNGKPIISSEPMEGDPKPKKGAAAASPAPKPSPQKRSAAPYSSEKESKKRQKPDLAEEGSPKKPLFQRIWSTEDEISVLNAMIEFVKRGSDVSSDLTGFHKFVQKSLSVDVTKNQVSEKIRRMKKKYQNFAKKGKEPSFSKDGENLVYELSKKIWGNDGEQGGTSTRSKITVKPKSPPPSKSENHNHGLKNIEVLYPYLNDSLHSGGIVSVGGFGDVDVKRAITLMVDSRAKEWDERCMKLRLKEKDIHMERATLAYELMKELYDADRSGLGMRRH